MKKIAVLFLSFVLLLNLCACGSIESVVSGGGAATTKEYKIGETATLDDVSVTLIEVHENNGSQFLSPEEGNVFVLCEFEIINNSSKEINVSSMMSFEAYCDDTSINLSISALSNKGNMQQLDGSISAGKKMHGVVGYEVPSNWSELEIQYTINTFGNDTLIFVATND